MIFSFDVESIGLYGQGYAVGGCLIDAAGNELSSFSYATNPEFAQGSESDRAWCSKNLPILPITHDSIQLLQEAFWQQYLLARHQNAQIVVDCGYPVEANFLSSCVRTYETTRKWLSAYPLLDLGALLLARGKDPRQRIQDYRMNFQYMTL